LCRLFALVVLVVAGGVPPAHAETASARIIRDGYGVPHIYADNTYALFYGYGYAVGQDRLFQMEMIKRTTSGRVAEVMGGEYSELDARVRQGFDPASLRQQLQRLEPEQSQVFDGYAAGLNRWIEEVNKASGSLMPKEFIDFGFKPSPWTAYDVVLVFAGSIAHRYADFNEEIANLAFYQELIKQHGEQKAWNIFNATLPLYHPASPTTVPESASSKRNVRYTGERAPTYLNNLLYGRISPTARAAFDPDDFSDSPQRQAYLDKHPVGNGVPGSVGFSSASNIWLVNQQKIKDAKGVLVNGPQFGWINPSYVYGVGLHGAGYNVVGNTLLAFPFMLFAHNKDISWGSTAGFGDLVDVYVNKLNPDNLNEYFYQNAYHPLGNREEIIKVRGQDDIRETFYRTLHGPVIRLDKENGLVYSKKRAWEGDEVATGIAWVELAGARNYQEWRAYLSKVALNINFYFLDKTGNIAYTHAGKYPIRADGHDNRMPAPGDGGMDWRGYLPFDKNPQVYNPSQGFIVNWNNRPARNWPNSDLWWVRWGRAHRVDVLFDELQAKDSFTPMELWDMNRRASFADVNAAYLLPYLDKAFKNKAPSKMTAQALQRLSAWDGYWRDDDGDGAYDTTGPLIMQAWLKRLLEAVFRDDIGEKYFHRFASPGYPQESIQAAISVSPGIKIIVDVLNRDINSYDFFNGEPTGQIIRDAFVAAIRELSQAQGTDIGKWKLKSEPLIFRAFNFRGAPQTNKDNEIALPLIMNRGSENNQFIAAGGNITGRDVFAPGESGFISPDGAKSPHYADQLQLYKQFKSKPLPFSEAEVESMKLTETIITIP